MANKKTGGTRLTGLNPLSYMGVEPSSPPQLVRYQRQPTNRDFGFNIGDLWLVEDPFEIWMLVDKPQNVAFWALIYPQAGGAGGISLIHTDAGDVVADVNGEIGIVGGENINIGTNGPNELVVNLNRTIQWPETNAAGSEGVIFLEGERFLHDYGDQGAQDDNTFLGGSSGNFTLTGTANTGLGSAALIALSSGANNVAVGSNTLPNTTTGSDNVAIGANAGSSLDTNDSDNICILNSGVANDAGVTRIGTEGTQVEAHLAGVFGSIVLGTVTPKTIINVDDAGQLGQLTLTSSGATIDITQPSNGVINLEAVAGNNFSQPFYAYQATDVNLPNGSPYAIGANLALTELFDVGNNFFPGDGAGTGCSFVAPATGIYNFILSAISPQVITGNAPRWIITTPARTYLARGELSQVYQLNITTDLTMGQVVTFSMSNPGLPANPWTIQGNSTSNGFCTSVSGYRIA